MSVLRVTIGEVLNGWLSPQDVLATVGDAIMGMETVPERPLAELYREARQLRREEEGLTDDDEPTKREAVDMKEGC